MLWDDLLELHPAGGQAERAAALGMDAVFYRQRLCKLRGKFRRLFRTAAGDGLMDPADLDAECVYLLRHALAQASRG